MPWTYRKRDSEWCVYKKNADGNPTGEALGCHDTKSEALAQIAALEANVEEMARSYVIAEFRGDFPEIAIDPRVDQDALFSRDEDPFFVTLPIARVGETSANGLHYDEALVETIREQMVGRGGIMGHISDDERDTAFPIEDVDWVGAQQENGTLWGKAYIPPGKVREFVRRLKARGGRLATSIYGPYASREELGDGAYRLMGFQLETLDLAPPDRAALNLGGRFTVTAQMIGETTEEDQDSEEEMERAQLIAELTVADLPDTLREQVIAEHQAEADTENRIAELESERDDAQKRAQELETQVSEFQAHQFEAAVDGVIAELVDWKVQGDDAEKRVKMVKDQLKNRILSEIGDDRDAEKLPGVAKEIWESDDMKLLAETVRDALSGGPAVVGGRRAPRTIEDTPEARQAARSRVGI